MSMRVKFIVVTAATLVPLAAIVMLVIALVYVPVFRALEELAVQTIYEMIPMHELQLAMHKSTMAARGDVSHGDFEQTAAVVDESYRRLLGIAELQGERRQTLEESHQHWLNATLALRRAWQDRGEQAGAVEAYVSTVTHLSSELDSLHAALHGDIIAQLDKASTAERRGYLLLAGAFFISMAVGIVGSVMFTRDRRMLEHRALVDPLTGAANRKGFETIFAMLAGPAFTRHASRFSLTLFDLDHFKSINDTHGHAVGDAALQAVVQAVRRCLRDGDHLARLGGDEFAILVPNVVGPEALALAERVRQAVTGVALTAEDETVIELRLSMGVASYPDDGATLLELTRAADAALYEAKRGGRDRVVASGEAQPSDQRGPMYVI